MPGGYRGTKKKSLGKAQQDNPNASNMTETNRRTTTNSSEINSEAVNSLEEIINFVRQNPTMAFGIHQQLTQSPAIQHPNIPIESSTPLMSKRNLDSSGNDSAPTSKQQRTQSNGKQKITNQTDSLTIRQSAQTSNIVPERTQQQTTECQQRRLPFEQLKRAVASNLPCFLIEYESSIDQKSRPSDVLAANQIEEHFKQEGINISFSLVGHVGDKLKLGVNSKEAYATLISTEKWPAQINEINITVIKPKFIPDPFALVVRYVPLQYNDEFVKEEIERNLKSAENVRRIQYRFERRTNDFRFVVKDLQEYNSTLKLGRISVGNSFCIITAFLSGNRMTYCTRCWCLGHMREKCEHEYPRCRICLDNLLKDRFHECSNVLRCAQCDGCHHSLSSECEKVTQYRADLKEQVNNALSTGKLHRQVPQGRTQPNQFQLKPNDFPPLPKLLNRPAPWQTTTANTHTNGTEDITKVLLSINQNVLEMKDNNHCMDRKLDRIAEKVDRINLDTELHHKTLEKILPALTSLIHDFIWPMMALDIAGLRKNQSQLQGIYSTFISLSSVIGAHNVNRRQRSVSPLPRLSLSQQSTANDNDQNNGTNQKMIK